MSRLQGSLRGSPALPAIALLLSLAACREEPRTHQFPGPGRDVAPIVGESFSTEDARDRSGEADEVFGLAEVKPSMSVADVGAGEGYYTVRLSPIVGRRGRVLAEDIMPDARDQLAQRVQRESLDNVAVRLGEEADPMLPAGSFDRIFLVHMYHEVTKPYEFLWHLRDGLKPNGMVIVVDSDRQVKRHGMPPNQLICEFGALGMEPVKVRRLTGAEAYFMSFRMARPKPEPSAIKACRPQ